jgi:glycosyltransferase involved in cell wall biosynthesis
MATEGNATGRRVSVITIFYNAADYLVEAIESVLAQGYRDFELLLVDDGSSDASSAIAQRYAAEQPDRIRYLHHPAHENRGMSAARNLGIRAACGEFIAFIDADDRWAPRKLHEQVEILDRFPEVDAVAGTVNYWRSWAGGDDRLVRTGHVQDRPVRPPEASLSLYPLGNAAAPCPSDLILRRSAVMRVRGFEETFTGPLQLYEDQAFLAKLYLTSTVYFADRIWLDYRLHDGSCVAAVSAGGRYHDVRRHFLEWFADYLSAGPEKPLAVRLALQRALLPYRFPRLTLAVRYLRKTRPR